MHDQTDNIAELHQLQAERAPGIIGYASRRSLRAGDEIDFFVSASQNEDYDAQLVRLKSPDIGPIGPTFKISEINAPINGRHKGRLQPIHIGSYAYIPGPIPITADFSIRIFVYPTLNNSREQTIVEMAAPNGSKLRVSHSSKSGLTAAIHTSDSLICATSIDVLREHAWTEIKVIFGASNSTLILSATPISNASHLDLAPFTSRIKFPKSTELNFDGASMHLAASASLSKNRHDPITTFNGKLERPRLYELDDTNTEIFTIADWDFSHDISSDYIIDLGPSNLTGFLHNLPTRGVRGLKWSGDCLSWVHDQDGYGAIHFHEDDLADAGWNISHNYVTSPDLPSGCYALRLTPFDNSTPEWFIPFFVRPNNDSQCAQVAFIVPTTTYGAYANMNLRVTAQFNELAHGRLTVLDSTDLLMIQLPELGKSTYDVHNDGSPIVFSSMNRPVTNFRPNGRIYKFCLDLMILDWLDEMEITADIITDDDIHREGLASLAPYKVVITSSHPEYETRNQLDALQKFTDSGGRLLYLGGNGFYTAAEIPSTHPDVVEVRRPGQDNLWRVNHTEGIFSSSGLPAGLWRNIGRPENALVGVGFIAQGFDECTFYRRSAASQDPRVAWIFEGLTPDEVIGDFGILQGGAAGYEVDRHDATKGSPAHSIVVASSSGHSPVYDIMVTSILDTLPQRNQNQDPIRADMVFFETNNNGAVFSVGSIAWAGSLSHALYKNNVSRVTLNVLRRFMDPAQFLA